MLSTVIALVIFLFPLAYSPGPGNLFFAANGARFGWRATLPANFGYHLATWVVTLAIGLGMSASAETAPQVFLLIKWAGVAYVVWLGLKFFTSGTTGDPDDTQARPAGWISGIALLLLNPKAYLIIGLMFSQFLSAEAENQFWPVIVIASVFTLNNFIAFMLWTLLGDRLAILFRHERHARLLNWVFGLLLIAVAIWMALG